MTEQQRRALQAYQQHGTQSGAARSLGISQSSFHNLLKRARAAGKQAEPQKAREGKPGLKLVQSDKSLSIEFYGEETVTLEQLVERAGVDLKIWKVLEVSANHWEVGGKANLGQEVISVQGEEALRWRGVELWKMPLRQIKARFGLRDKGERAVQSLLDDLAKQSPVVRKIKRPKPKRGRPKRALEIDIMDPHLGLHCFPDDSGKPWTLEDCESLYLRAVESLLQKAASFGPFDEIVFPFGNDFLHVDNLQHTTTAGTPQEEAISFPAVYDRGLRLVIAAVERLKEVAPVKVYSVLGNHDETATYTLGKVLDAYYRNDKNVTVDARYSPYKFWRYGATLIGFEHGKSVKPIRLAAVMANEARQDWAETTHREWHLGDQHREGSAKPSMMEEQGVGIMYLMALTPTNRWHRKHGFNWQRRGATAFVYDYHTGPEARLQCNLNSYTGLTC